jgi:hypothetical protein
MSLPDPAPADQQPTAAEHLPDDPATLKRMVMELLASLHERDIEALRHRLDLLLRRLYGPRGERFNPNQLLLFAGPAAGQEADAEPIEPAEATKPQRRCRPHGRRRMPGSLPRESRRHELPEVERVCRGCGRMRIDIGADKSEQLDYRPASLFVVEHFVHKYACPVAAGGRSTAKGSNRSRGRSPSPCWRTNQSPSRRRRRAPSSGTRARW